MELETEKPELLILHSAWMLEAYHYTSDELKNKLTDILIRIKKSLPTTKIIIIGPVPKWRISPQNSSYIYWSNNKHKEVPERLAATQLTELDKELSKIAKNQNISYISVLPILCNDDGCIARLGNTIDDFVQVDYGHLTKAGSEFLLERIKNDIVVNLPKGERP